MVLVPEACYNTLLLSLYLDLPPDSSAVGQDIMIYKFMLSRYFCSKVNLKPLFVVSDLQVPSAKLLCRILLILSAFKIRIPNSHKLKRKKFGLVIPNIIAILCSNLIVSNMNHNRNLYLHKFTQDLGLTHSYLETHKMVLGKQCS